MSVVSTRILGIDPGVAIMGWGVVELRAGDCSHVAGGVVRTSPTLNTVKRLLQLRTELIAIIAQHKPDICAMEKLFFSNNQKTAMMVAEGRGVALCTVGEHALTCIELTPLQVKQALTNSGSADKTQVGKMVQLLLKLEKIPTPDDHADALAIAIAGSRYVNTR